MKRKILTIILSILLVFLICTTIYKLKFPRKKETSKNETNRNFIMSENSNINTNGENTVVYVGTSDSNGDNYILVSFKLNKNTSKEEQAKSLISKISESLGYKIDINLIEIDENKIKVDFAKTAAPFDMENSFLDNVQPKFYPSADFIMPKAIFDSINRTFKSYFGENSETYFSVDSENIIIENEILPISIDMTKPY